MLALSDTPSSILLDTQLGTGLSSGSSDLNIVISVVESYRRSVLTPLYNFLDKIILYKLANLDYIQELRPELSEEKLALSDEELIQDIIDSYSWQYDSLFSITPEEEIARTSSKLEVLSKLATLGATTECIEEQINNDNLFPSEIKLDGNIVSMARGSSIEEEVINDGE